MAQRTDTGIGRALRRARLRQGKSLEDASRDTRVRTDYLHALEREAWGALTNDVYVRGFLRSYSRYLGLNPEKVIQVYERTSRRPKPPPAPVEKSPGVAPSEAVVLTGGNRRSSWMLAAAIAVAALAAAGGIGLFSERSAPESASPDLPPPTALVASRVVVDLRATGPVDVRVTPDEEPPIDEHLTRGEQVSFTADERIRVQFSGGGRVRMEVNGTDLGIPGFEDEPFQATYVPSDFRGAPSPTAASTSAG
jgi:hypothetical protein